MTHRFFVTPEHIQGEEVRFADAQVHQMRSVLRLRAGDHVQVFDGTTACDLVVELEAGLERGRVVGQQAQAPEPRTRLVVYPALLQRDKFESVLQKLTEVGVAAIVPVITDRTLVREAPDDRRRQRWTAILREAAEQSGRGVVPRLLPTSSFSDSVVKAEGTRLVAYEGERERDLHAALASRPPCVSVFVGPEGGFTPEEVALAREAQADVVTLGPRVLRTETASPVLAALVLYELGDLSWPQNQP
jgi:16S rRNA (uracil1498-N3)-methyltransferase